MGKEGYMKLLARALVFLCLMPVGSSTIWARESTGIVPQRQIVSPKNVMPKSIKGATVVPSPFRVTSVQFNTVSINSQTRVVAAVIFNKNINAATVQQNLNIRLLKKNENHFWVDASTQNNTLQVRPNSIVWQSGAPLENGYYVMHLRGTIKSQDGLYLDCNGDGVGEGGNLPAFESQIYQVSNVITLEEHPMDPGRVKDLIDGL